MAFDKEAFKKEATELIKKEGKADLKEFLEENAKTVWKVVQLYVKHLNNPIFLSILAAASGIIDGLIEDINKEDNV